MATYHVGGLASGMDIQAIVDSMVKAKSVPLTIYDDEKSAINEKVSAWAEINTALTDITSSLDFLRDYTLWNTMAATSSDESVMTATAGTSAINANYIVEISKLAQAHSVGSNKASDLLASATETTNLVGTVLTAGDKFTIEGQTITIDATTESLSSLMGKINAAASSMGSSVRVIASIMDHRLVITRNNSGSSQIVMSETIGSPLQALKIFSAPATYNATNVFRDAQNAEFSVNGADITRSNNTGLTDVISGVTLNLKTDTLTSGAITLDITHDTNQVKTALQDFVDKYNTASELMTAYGTTTLTGDGSAKGATVNDSGLLFDDSLLHSIMSNIRKYATGSKSPYLNSTNASYTYNSKTGVCDNLDDIGISTASKENVLAMGDEDKLDYMLENNFDKVQQLFRGVFDADKGYIHGVATDFYAYMNHVTESMSGEIATHDSTYKSQITRLDTKTKDLTAEIETWTQELWARFGAMEDAIAQMQSDLTSLTSKLGN